MSCSLCHFSVPFVEDVEDIEEIMKVLSLLNAGSCVAPGLPRVCGVRREWGEPPASDMAAAVVHRHVQYSESVIRAKCHTCGQYKKIGA